MQVTQLKHESRFVVHELFCHVAPTLRTQKVDVVVMIPPNSAEMIDE
jgi:predicted P-loop ATPase/GTPase